MKISYLKTNRIANPLGFSLDKPRLSYIVTETEAKKQIAARIEVALDKSCELAITGEWRCGQITVMRG